jgi:hypothetical protein
MDNVWKERWVNALRSGDFKQVNNVLTQLENGNVVGHCCLGVLAEVYVQHDGDVTVTEDEESRYYKFGDMTPPLSGILGAAAYNVFDFSPGVESTLIGMNDDERKSFAEIADWIEENL